MQRPPGVWRTGVRVLIDAIRTEPRSFAVGAVGALLYAAGTIGSSVVLGMVTDRVVLPALRRGEVRIGALVLAAVAILAVAVVRAAGVLGRRFGAYLMQYRLQAIVRHRLVRRYLELPLVWHRRRSTGDLVSVVSSDVEAAFFTIAPLPMAVGVALMLLVTAGLLVATDPFLTAVGFTAGPVLAYLNWTYQHRMAAVATRAQELRGEVAAAAHESIDAGLVIKVLGREQEETARFASKSDELRDRMVDVGRLRARFDPLVEALPNVAILLVLLVGTWRIAHGALTPGEVVGFAYLFGLLALPMRVFGWLLGEFPRSVAGWRRVSEVLDVPDRIADGTRTLDGDGALAVEVDAVTFRHPDLGPDGRRGPHAPLTPTAVGGRGLEAVSLTVPPGRVVAVVGPTGAGKSTLVALLVRLFDPDRGSIRYDGQRYETLTRRSLSRAVAAVFQDTFLFDDTVRHNVTLGEPLDDDTVWWALQLARADTFVAGLPDGLDTPVGERGATLSGGQRQRLALARALVRRPRLLILDDATSAVDPAVERSILDGLFDGALASTVLVVASRPATIAMADEVVFVDRGRVLARGTHEELMSALPAYAELLTAYEREAYP